MVYTGFYTIIYLSDKPYSMRYEPISLYLVKPATWEQFGWGITVLKDVQLHLPCLVTRILNRIGFTVLG